VAVALQTNAPAGQCESVFDDQKVHAAARRYLQNGQLVLPLERMIANGDCRYGLEATPRSCAARGRYQLWKAGDTGNPAYQLLDTPVTSG
jgi:hypothetical protein